MLLLFILTVSPLPSFFSVESLLSGMRVAIQINRNKMTQKVNEIDSNDNFSYTKSTDYYIHIILLV